MQRSRQVLKLKAGTLLNYWRNSKEARVTRAEQAVRTRGEHGSDCESACESRQVWVWSRGTSGHCKDWTFTLSVTGKRGRVLNKVVT